MDFGIALATSTESWKVVQRAESARIQPRLVLRHAAAQPDVFIGMTMAAMHTAAHPARHGRARPFQPHRSRHGQCPGHAQQARAGPHRFRGRYRVYRAPHHGVAGNLHCTVHEEPTSSACRSLVLGADRDLGAIEGSVHEIGFLNPDLGLINLEDPIRAAPVGDGTERARGSPPSWGPAGSTSPPNEASRQSAPSRACSGAWQEAGRAGGRPLFSTLFLLGVVLLEPGNPSTASASSLRPGRGSRCSSTTWWRPPSRDSMEGHSSVSRSPICSSGTVKIYLGYPAKRRHLHNHKWTPDAHASRGAFSGHRRELIEAMTFTGDCESLRGRVERLRSAGYRQLTVQLVEGQEHAIEDWARVFGLDDAAA
jgi:5,10-methylenetetrahydromethanopterin reductase